MPTLRIIRGIEMYPNAIIMTWEREFTANSLDQRRRIEDLLGKALEEKELGICDGGGFGIGYMDVYCYVNDVKDALGEIESVLTAIDMWENAVILDISPNYT